MSANPVDYAVTTAHKQTPEMVVRALEIAAVLHCVYVERNERSLETLLNNRSLSGLVVVATDKISYVSDEGEEFFFHPGLSGLRINQLTSGHTDRMIEAMSLEAGDRVLDCTLGLGTDAVVAGHVAGTAGCVVGLECSPVLAYLVGTGLSAYTVKDKNLTEAMRRVQVMRVDHLDYLQNLAAGSFDVIYFDPMFRAPRMRSTAINSLRSLADPAPVTGRAVDLAVNAAGKRVVMKERRGSPEFARLGFSVISGGRYAPVKYGVIDCHGR